MMLSVSKYNTCLSRCSKPSYNLNLAEDVVNAATAILVVKSLGIYFSWISYDTSNTSSVNWNGLISAFLGLCKILNNSSLAD